MEIKREVMNIFIDGIEYVPKASHTEAKGIDWIVMALLAEGMIIKRDNYKPVAKTFDELYLEDKYPIHSVLRYDGVVFSVDDNTDRGFVYSFEIAGNEMIATFKGNGGFSNINFLSKPLQRTPLLKTVDGFDKYEGDLVWRIAKDLIDGQHPRQINIHPDHVYPDRIYFESLDALKEYVILNKPCLSVNDAIGLWAKDGYFPMKAKELAKQRLDKQ